MEKRRSDLIITNSNFLKNGEDEFYLKIYESNLVIIFRKTDTFIHESVMKWITIL